MNRRQFLRGGAVLGVSATGYAGWRHWPEEGLANPCLDALPQEVMKNEVARRAFADLDAAQVWDCHVHLVGVGDGG
ncbi:MAG TPA: hypothetical protein VLN59_12710, partial [Burkholderiales bacterium]|nr:hypothetical protein [Burkholderiales bacterium]